MNSKEPKKNFKEKYTLAERKQDAKRKINENPGHVPIVVLQDKKSKIPNMENGK